MEKDFIGWNALKENIDNSNRPTYFHQREIWWCSLGINVGVEIDGKHENYERPVVIMKVYNTQSLIILPLTSQVKNDVYHHRVINRNKVVWAKLTQSRVISSKRLLRKIDKVPLPEFQKLRSAWLQSL